MELNVNIEQVVADAVAAALSPENIQPIIQANVEKAVKGAIDDQFSYRSPFKQLLEAKMAEVMPKDIEDMGRFGDLVMKTVSAHVNSVQAEFVKQSIEPKLAALLAPAPATMKLSDLVKELVPALQGSYKCDESDEKPTIIFERSTGLTSDFWYLYIDHKEGRSKYSCHIQASFHEGKCFTLRIDDEELQKKLFIGPIIDAGRIMLNLYTCQTLIEVDQTDFSDVYYGEREEC